VDVQTATAALRSGQRVRATTANGTVFEGQLDGHWIMAKAGYLEWQRYYPTSVPQGDNVQLGREFWTLRFAVEGPGVPAGLESSVDVTLDELEIVEDVVKVEKEESKRMTRTKLSVAPTTTVGDYTWCLKSTTEERGMALLQVALEWSGDGEHELSEREVVGHATEQLINLLAATTHRFGNRAALKIIAEAMDRAEEWDQED